MVHLWMLQSPGFISTLLWFSSSLPLSVSLMLYLIEVSGMRDVSADRAPAAGRCRVAAGRHYARVTLEDEELLVEQLINQTSGCIEEGVGSDD